jgi:hypothetical protein
LSFSRSIAALAAVAAALAATLGAPATAQAPRVQDVPVAAGEGVWLAGDLHVHTPYSHDSYGGPDDDNTGFEEAYLLGNTVEGNFRSAAAKGLDYLAITDHNDIRSQSDPGFGFGGVTPIHAYENSLNGHAQMLGARKIYDAGDKTAPAVSAMAEELHGHGGAFQVNHPAEGSTDFPHDVDWGYGYEVVPKTVEVWNISRLWQPPMPSASSNDDAVRYWEGWLDRGYRIGATGGSDSHYIWTSLTLLGSPTTWVYAAENSEAAILDALRAGRTFISHQPPTLNGPRLFLEGDEDGNGEYEAMVGDAVAPGSQLRVRVEGAPGSFLRVITDGGRLAFEPVPVTGPAFEHSFTMPPEATWVRAEIFDPDLAEERRSLCDEPFGGESTYCRNMLAVAGMTSAMYFEDGRSPVATTTLDYTGQTRGKGEMVELAAKLLDEGSAPVVGETVSFSILGKTYRAVTDASGVASATANVPDHGRSTTVHVNFAGTERLTPSHANAIVTWGRAK